MADKVTSNNNMIILLASILLNTDITMTEAVANVGLDLGQAHEGGRVELINEISILSSWCLVLNWPYNIYR